MSDMASKRLSEPVAHFRTPQGRADRIAIFTGLRELRLADLHPGSHRILKVLSVIQAQLEGIRYRVFNMEQDFTLAFYCADFEFSA